MSSCKPIITNKTVANPLYIVANRRSSEFAAIVDISPSQAFSWRLTFSEHKPFVSFAHHTDWIIASKRTHWRLFSQHKLHVSNLSDCSCFIFVFAIYIHFFAYVLTFCSLFAVQTQMRIKSSCSLQLYIYYFFFHVAIIQTDEMKTKIVVVPCACHWSRAQ